VRLQVHPASVTNVVIDRLEAQGFMTRAASPRPAHDPGRATPDGATSRPGRARCSNEIFATSSANGSCAALPLLRKLRASPGDFDE
jgi:hypothetical protein